MYKMKVVAADKSIPVESVRGIILSMYPEEVGATRLEFPVTQDTYYVLNGEHPLPAEVLKDTGKIPGRIRRRKRRGNRISSYCLNKEHVGADGCDGDREDCSRVDVRKYTIRTEDCTFNVSFITPVK